MRNFLFSVGLAAITAASAFADDMFEGVNEVAADNGRGLVIFDNLNPDIMRMDVGERVSLNFGSGYEAELDRLDVQAMGANIWVGRIADHTIHNRILITQTNGYTFGQIRAPDGLFYIYPGSHGRHEILQITEDDHFIETPGDYLVPDVNILRELAASNAPVEGLDGVQTIPADVNDIIDIALFYTDSFVTRWGLATSGRVQYLVAFLDQALIDSQTGMRARLVHSSQVSITTETSDQSQTLVNLTGSDLTGGGQAVTQDLSALRTARDTFGADLAAIVQRSQTGQSSCGLAWLNGGSSDVIGNSSAVAGYSVNADWIRDTDTPSGSFSLCADRTFAHEIGHNMGMAHNVENSSGVGSGVRAYAHGHRVDGSFRTIMAYDSGASETAVNYFSNPSITLCPGGAACGIAASAPVDGFDAPQTNDPADVARAAREEGRNVTGFRAVAPRVVSSVLPTTRTVQTGNTATAFASMINPGATGSTATGCGLRLSGATAAQFSYQTTTAANALTGTPNTTVSIPAGGVQNFVFSVTSADAFSDNVRTPGFFPSVNDETNLFIEAFCDNRRSGEYNLGLNSLTFRASDAAPVDIVALAASGDPGRVNVPTTGNFVGVFSVAISNVGVAGSVTVTADTGTQTLAVNEIEICQTDPGTGACTNARENTKTLTVPANGTATFGIFVRGTGAAIANDPARNRVFVRFASGGAPVGATSVAVRTQ
ncbi:reprolysin-like metallopeptidase [Hyphobacterium sp.]|uniref:reprolysin-like metallopeptidase n=1 Tax=Hyphobacterium sp. TaxID=2004662 RepID=UPI003BAAD8AA